MIILETTSRVRLNNDNKRHANRDIKRVSCFAHEMQGMSILRK